jgi:hypothetical protein
MAANRAGSMNRDRFAGMARSYGKVRAFVGGCVGAAHDRKQQIKGSKECLHE